MKPAKPLSFIALFIAFSLGITVLAPQLSQLAAAWPKQGPNAVKPARKKRLTAAERKAQIKAQREKKAKERREKFIQALPKIAKYGTDDEIRGALHQVSAFKLKKDIERIRPFARELLGGEPSVTVAANTIRTLQDLKLKEYAALVTPFVSHEDEVVRQAALRYVDKLDVRYAEGAVLDYYQKADLSKAQISINLAVQVLAHFKNKRFGDYTYATLVKAYGSQVGWKDGATADKTAKKDKGKSNNKKASSPATSEGWEAEVGGKLDDLVANQLILALGRMQYKKAGPFFNQVFKAAIKSEDGLYDDDDDIPAHKLGVSQQGYVVNAMGRMKYQKAVDPILKKVGKMAKYDNEKKKRFRGMRNQCLVALARLGSKEGRITLVEALKDSSAAARADSAKTLARVRDAGSVTSLGYRAMHDTNAKVRFESLKALMEMVHPGSTTGGRVDGQPPTAAARQAATSAIVRYMDYDKNPQVHFNWLRFIAKNVDNRAIEQAVVRRMEKKAEHFINNDQQKVMAAVAAAYCEKYIKAGRSVNGPAKQLLEKMATDGASRGNSRTARLRRTAVKQAALHLRILKKLAGERGRQL